jgi:DNA repair protein RadC
MNAKEYKVICLRECPAMETMPICDTPDLASNYWRDVIATDARFDPEVEQAAVVLLNIRRRVKGHVMISKGTVDACIVHPREVYRAAIIASASGIVLMHNHPSGDTTPSAGDIKCTKEIRAAGKILKIELVDHVIWSPTQRTSLRELGMFYD